MIRVLFLLCLFAASPARAAVTFEVLAIDGNFAVWSDRAAEWLKLKPGVDLPEDSLVQTLTSGSLLLARKEPGRNVREMSLNADSSLICRLTVDVLREVDLTSVYADGLAQGAKASPTVGVAFKSAWERINAIYLTAKADKKPPKEPKPEGGSGKDLPSMAPIATTILHPKKGAIVITDKFPVALPILWFPPTKAKEKYKIHLGVESTGERLPLVGLATGTHFVAPVYAEGAYSVAIDRGDGKGPEKVGSFYVLLVPAKATAAVADPAKNTH